MTVTLGVSALLEAKPDKGDDLAAFLESGRSIAAGEDGTVTWYAFKVDDDTYGIFDTFESQDGLDAHLGGEIPKALAQVGPELLATDPDIRTVEIVAVDSRLPRAFGSQIRVRGVGKPPLWTKSGGFEQPRGRRRRWGTRVAQKHYRNAD